MDIQRGPRQKKFFNRNESRNITTNSTEIKRLYESYEQFYTNKLDNLDDMDKFLETYTLLPRLNHEKVENMNRPVTSKDLNTKADKDTTRKVQINIPYKH